MAAQVAHQEISCASSQASRVSSRSSTSEKSFCSWGSRPSRDSLDMMRQRNRIATASPLNHQMLESVRNFSDTSQNEDRSQEETVEGGSSISLGTRVNLWPHRVSRNTVCARYPKGKASLLVFILNIIASCAFGAAIVGILDIFIVRNDERVSPQEEDTLRFIQLLFQRCISRVFYPLAGFIADVYIGRCRMIHTALILLWIGYAGLVVSYLIDDLINFDFVTGLKVMRVICFLFISAGGGAFEATIIPFGVDQLQGASSAEISSYFYFYYFSRNLGITCGMVMYSMITYLSTVEARITDSTELSDLYSVLESLVMVTLLTVGLVLNVCLSHWYFKNTLWENPVRLVAKVLCYAATVKRHLPVRRRAFRYGEEKKSRIDLAKVQYDGKFSAEQVEDVKTFCRICLLLLAMFPALVSLNAFYTFTTYEVNITLTEEHPHGKILMDCVYPNAFTTLNSLFVLLSIPGINFCVIPCFPKLTIRVRIGIGLLLYCVGMVIIISIHAFSPNSYRQVRHSEIWCLLLPIIIFSVAETLTVVSALEFIYAQSPESMKGFLTGVFYFAFGLSSLISSLAFYEYTNTQGLSSLLVYHVIFTGIQVVGLVFYGIVAALHKNRLRPDEDSFNQQVLIRGHLN